MRCNIFIFNRKKTVNLMKKIYKKFKGALITSFLLLCIGNLPKKNCCSANNCKITLNLIYIKIFSNKLITFLCN